MMKAQILVFAAILAIACSNHVAAVPLTQGLVFHVDAADPLGNGGSALPTNGAALPTWTNLGSYGAAANASTTGTMQPLWFSSGGAANAPRINFDGVNDRLIAGTAADWKFLNYVDNTTYLGSSVYVVYQTTDANPNALLPLLSTGGTSGGTRGYDLFYDDRTANSKNDQLRIIISKGAGSHIDITNMNNTFAAQTWGLVNANYGLGIAGPDATLRVSGTLVNSQETGSLPMVDANPVNSLNIGKLSNSNIFNKGDYSEILMYNEYHVAAKRTLVENYLSAKYSGTTITQQLPISNDRYAGDTLANGNYDRDVFGIGRESDGTVATGTSGSGLNIADLTMSLDTNGEYVLAGHKQPGTVSFVDDAIGGMQWNREWYIDATTTGSVAADLTFDFDDVGLTLDPLKNYQLLYKADESVATFSVLAALASYGANQVSFSVLFDGTNDGIYTLGITPPAPEPSTCMLLGFGMAAVSLRRRKNRRS